MTEETAASAADNPVGMLVSYHGHVAWVTQLGEDGLIRAIDTEGRVCVFAGDTLAAAPVSAEVRQLLGALLRHVESMRSTVIELHENGHSLNRADLDGFLAGHGLRPYRDVHQVWARAQIRVVMPGTTVAPLWDALAPRTNDDRVRHCAITTVHADTLRVPSVVGAVSQPGGDGQSQDEAAPVWVTVDVEGLVHDCADKAEAERLFRAAVSLG
jgi:hypothetical protein